MVKLQYVTCYYNPHFMLSLCPDGKRTCYICECAHSVISDITGNAVNGIIQISVIPSYRFESVASLYKYFYWTEYWQIIKNCWNAGHLQL